MALERKYYQDPALHVKFEREINPCFGCIHIAKIFGKSYCERGRKMDKKCSLYRDKKQ